MSGSIFSITYVTDLSDIFSLPLFKDVYKKMLANVIISIECIYY